MADRIGLISIRVSDDGRCHPECPHYSKFTTLGLCKAFAIPIIWDIRCLQCHDAETAMAVFAAKLTGQTERLSGQPEKLIGKA